MPCYSNDRLKNRSVQWSAFGVERFFIFLQMTLMCHMKILLIIGHTTNLKAINVVNEKFHVFIFKFYDTYVAI